MSLEASARALFKLSWPKASRPDSPVFSGLNGLMPVGSSSGVKLSEEIVAVRECNVTQLERIKRIAGFA
ncbi:hypothetical protein AA23498_2627 [Acetobacter nitrogenifigens DSM 23921 = NBRC 105050]|nr:hypothetical protein AA23498_2627 [Acetobacter nitrogenifigens DSM 23921 = NBRC 105050]